MKTRFKILLSLVFIITGTYIQAQQVCETTTFQKDYGTPNIDDLAFDIVETPDHGFITGGWAGPEQDRGILMKVDEKGDVVWLKQLTDNITLHGIFKKFLHTRDGNYIAVGTVYMPTATFYDIMYTWVVKFDESGTIIWNKMFYPPGGISNIPAGVVETADGGLAIAGGYQLITNYGGALIIKLDADGNLLWSKGYISSSIGTGVAHTGILELNGVLFISGSNTSVGCGLVIKMNSADGTFLAASQIKINNNFTWFSNIEEKNNKFYISGWDIDQPTGIRRQVIFITDADLNILHNYKLDEGFEEVYDPVPLSAGNEEGFVIAPAKSGRGNFILARISDEGDIKWKKEYARSGSQVIYNVKQTTNGGIFGIGASNSDESPFYEPGNDIFIFKTDGQGISGDCPSTNTPMTISIPSYTQSSGAITYNDAVLSIINLHSEIHDVTIPVTTYCKKIFTPTCSLLQISGEDTICNLKDQVEYEVTKNAGCDLPVSWKINPEFAKIVSSTDTKLVVQFIKAGVTGITASIASGCENISRDLAVYLYQQPQGVSLGADQALCGNSNITLNATTGFKDYVWQDGSTGSSITIRATGNYSVTATNNCLEKFQDTIVIRRGLIPANFAPADTAICEGSPTILKSQAGLKSYRWSTGETSANIRINAPGNYTLLVTNEDGCSATEDITVASKAGCVIDLFVPTAFTPNNDGSNDLFRATAYGFLTKFHFTVYDRYGNIVFETNDIANGWNGKFKGVDQNAGGFVWFCQYKLNNKPLQTKKGIVALVR